MVNVTENAKKALNDLRSDAVSKLPEEVEVTQEPSLRLIIQGSQAGLALDFPQEGDQRVEHEGHTVLVIDPMVGQVLDGTTVDVTNTPEGNRLTITRDGQEPGQEQS